MDVKHRAVFAPPSNLLYDMKTQRDYWKEAHDQVMAEMSATKKRFILGRGPIDKSILLFIEDYAWWTINEREVLNWMNDNLPRGIDHQQGMVLTYDDESQRNWFLLRWA